MNLSVKLLIWPTWSEVMLGIIKTFFYFFLPTLHNLKQDKIFSYHWFSTRLQRQGVQSKPVRWHRFLPSVFKDTRMRFSQDNWATVTQASSLMSFYHTFTLTWDCEELQRMVQRSIAQLLRKEFFQLLSRRHVSLTWPRKLELYQSLIGCSYQLWLCFSYRFRFWHDTNQVCHFNTPQRKKRLVLD